MSLNSQIESIHETDLVKQCNDIIKGYLESSNGYYLLRIDSYIDWKEITENISININNYKELNFDDTIVQSLWNEINLIDSEYNKYSCDLYYKMGFDQYKTNLQVLIKCIILEKFYKISITDIHSEIINNKVFMKFLHLYNEEEVPTTGVIASFYNFLIEKELYASLLEHFYQQLFKNNFELSDRFESIASKDIIEDETEGVTDSGNTNIGLHTQMYDLFFKNLDENINEEIPNTYNKLHTSHIMEKLHSVDDYIKELKIKIQREKNGFSKRDEQTEFRPKFKKEGIFNDENLTEDYEIGYRFYQLRLKMGFFNVKLDNNNESSRICTAEFFPNTFWTCVKQRSRWIAGICFQNWKVNKWKGNLTTKYFMFRDRKSLFSLPSTFLSNLILIYMIYAIIVNIFYDKNIFLVSNSSVLWYLMAANVLFMVSRASHRFIFTYNWYGFKYAFFSFFRLLIDTSINFFAVLRSINVYKKTKKKVVWDATTHY